MAWAVWGGLEGVERMGRRGRCRGNGKVCWEGGWTLKRDEGRKCQKDGTSHLPVRLMAVWPWHHSTTCVHWTTHRHPRPRCHVCHIHAHPTRWHLSPPHAHPTWHTHAHAGPRVAREVVGEGTLLLGVLRVLLRLRSLAVIAVAAGFNAGDGGRCARMRSCVGIRVCSVRFFEGQTSRRLGGARA